MNKLDQIFISSVLYPIFPILLFLTGWWGSLPLMNNQEIFTIAIIGLLLGILIDFLFIKKIIPLAYKIRLFWPILIMIFYAVGMFGFFMGVPVFHIFLGIPIGWYIARRAAILRLSPPQYHHQLLLARLFGSGLICIVCIASALFAMNDPYTAANLKGMLSLPFELTKAMLIGLILIGGIGLIIGEYFLFFLVAKTFRPSLPDY